MAIEILTVNESLVVDSRLIADELGIKHRGLRQTIDRYLTELQEFGAIAFEMQEFKTTQGNTSRERYCFLNEDQAIFLMTLSRNTLQVVQCKKNLVKAFSEAKKFIKEEENARLKGEVKMLRDKIESDELRARLSAEDNENIRLAFEIYDIVAGQKGWRTRAEVEETLDQLRKQTEQERKRAKMIEDIAFFVYVDIEATGRVPSIKKIAERFKNVYQLTPKDIKKLMPEVVRFAKN